MRIDPVVVVALLVICPFWTGLARAEKTIIGFSNKNTPGGQHGARTGDGFQSHLPLDVKLPEDLDRELKERLARGREAERVLNDTKGVNWPEDLDRALKARLKGNQEAEQTVDLLKKLMQQNGPPGQWVLSPEDLKKFRADLPRFLKLRADLQQLMQGNTGGNEDLSKNIQDLLEKLKSNPGSITSLQEMAKKLSTNPDSPSPLSNTPFRPNHGESTNKTLSNRMGDFLTKKLTSAASWLETNGYDQDGAAIKAALEQFSSIASQPSGSSLDNLKSFVNGLETVTGQISPEKLGLDSLHQLLPKMNLKLPPISAPPTVPSWQGFGSGPNLSTNNGSPVVLWIALAVLGCLIAWKLPEWRKHIQSNQGQLKESGIPDWTVQPGRIRTRGELIRAFEQVSELCLGPDARTCSHKELADRLGGNSQNRRKAADDLAWLYEQVRYMPELADSEEPLLEADQQTARQALCLLAGVSPE